MKLFCPHCGVKGVADDAYRGGLVKCPKCLGTFVAVEPETAERQAPERPPAGAGNFTRSANQAELQAGQESPEAETPEAESAEAIDESAEVNLPGEEEIVQAQVVEEDVAEEEKTEADLTVELPEEEGPETELEWEESLMEVEALTEEEMPVAPLAEEAEVEVAGESKAEADIRAVGEDVEEEVVEADLTADLPEEEGPEKEPEWEESLTEVEALTEEEMPVAPIAEVDEVEEPVREETVEGIMMPAETEEAGEPGRELDWDEIAAEIETTSTAEERGKDEELPASLFAEVDEEYREPGPDVEIQAGPELVEHGEVGDQVPLDEPQAHPAEPEGEEAAEEKPAATKVEEAPDHHFIFEDQEPAQEVEDKPYGLIREQCWQCGQKNRGEVPYTERGGRLFCPACAPYEPEAVPGPPPAAAVAESAVPPSQVGEAVPPVSQAAERPKPTIAAMLKEAWTKTRGAKGSIWAGSAVMYLTILVLIAGGNLLLPMLGLDLAAQKPALNDKIAGYLFRAVINITSVVFSAGLILMSIRQVKGEPISWKMIFAGLPSVGKLIVAWFLQSFMIFLGFLVLVLPGIYLAVGYSMTIPLIVDRKMSPWQAMETSRKAIHKVWWRVAGLYFLMGLFLLVSMVPLGLGLIWTWPMFVILAGVVYRSLMASEK